MLKLEAFRQPEQAQKLAAAIRQHASRERHYRLMEFCGGHTHAIYRYGLPHLLPDNIEFVHGPGCPVCVLPAQRLDLAISLAAQPDTIVCTYADLMRVPASNRMTLWQAKAVGGDVRSIYSTQQALEIAAANPQRQVVFFAIGFETTAPATAVAILQAAQRQLSNFSVLCNHVLTPAAMLAILDAPQPASIDGVLGPSHVSVIIGAQAYAKVATHCRMPIVIAGFEPLDILQSVLMLIQQINRQQHVVENQYTRAVTDSGNQKAQGLLDTVFCARAQFDWRGLGSIANSALAIKPQYSAYDAEQLFTLRSQPSQENKACECPAILRGQKKPQDCKLLGQPCTPANPLGACMVSSEGACAAYWAYGRGLLKD